jgi:hypothetical protein
MDNVDIERCLKTFKDEDKYLNEFDILEGAKVVCEESLYFYNRKYLNSALRYVSSIEFDTQ